MPSINSSLSFVLDVSNAKALAVNKNAPICFQGQTHGHKGFLLNAALRAKAIIADARNSEVIKPYLSAEDLLSTVQPAPRRWVIDFQPRTVTQAAAFEQPFTRINMLVLPHREKTAEKEGTLTLKR